MLVKDYEPDYIMHTPLSIEITDVRHYHAHRHKNAVEFIYCISGSVVIRIAQEDLILKEGQVVTIDHDDIHFMHSDAKNILLIVHLNMASVAGNWESVKYIFISCASYYCKYYQKDDIDKVCDLLLTAAYIYLSKKRTAYGC